MQHYKTAEIMLTDNHPVENFFSFTAELINFGTCSVDLKWTPCQCD